MLPGTNDIYLKILVVVSKIKSFRLLGFENRHGLIGKEVSIVEYPDGKIEMLWGLRVIPIKIIPKVGCPKFEEYTETAKTIDARVDEIMAKENQRRQLWLNKRAAKVKRSTKHERTSDRGC